jgi:hypothetical protein
VPWRIFGPKGDEVTEEWRKLNSLYSSPNYVRVIKSRRMRWEKHVGCMGGAERCIQGFDGET